jgi:hypothetical protein
MRSRLPLNIENRELAIDTYNNVNRKDSYGYVNVLYLSSLIITAAFSSNLR